MYTDSPEEHLQSRGLLYPIKLPSKQIQSIGEEKHKNKKIKFLIFLIKNKNDLKKCYI